MTVFVLTAFRDGGAVGFNDWKLVAVYLNRSDAEAARDHHNNDPENRRWDYSIKECAVLGTP